MSFDPNGYATRDELAPASRRIAVPIEGTRNMMAAVATVFEAIRLPLLASMSSLLDPEMIDRAGAALVAVLVVASLFVMPRL